MRPRIALGLSDFRMLREQGALYVDKTRMVSDVIRDPGQAILLPRPRRFGKTLNLSMLRSFFERSEQDAASAGFEQIRSRDYTQRLRERGADPIRELVLVFDGKRATARAG